MSRCLRRGLTLTAGYSFAGLNLTSGIDHFFRLAVGHKVALELTAVPARWADAGLFGPHCIVSERIVGRFCGSIDKL